MGSTREAYVAKSKTNRPHEEFLITTNVAQLETVLISIYTTTLYDGKEWCDLENRVRVRSRSLKMAPFDR